MIATATKSNDPIMKLSKAELVRLVRKMEAADSKDAAQKLDLNGNTNSIERADDFLGERKQAQEAGRGITTRLAPADKILRATGALSAAAWMGILSDIYFQQLIDNTRITMVSPELGYVLPVFASATAAPMLYSFASSLYHYFINMIGL